MAVETHTTTGRAPTSARHNRTTTTTTPSSPPRWSFLAVATTITAASLLPLSSATSSNSSYGTQCLNSRLECHHGGTCRTGTKDWTLEPFSVDADLPWMSLTNMDGAYCEGCDEGYTGIGCAKKYESCDVDEDANAVPPTCFHGATCHRLGEDKGEADYICDCTNAIDEKDGGSLKLRYAGEFCQHVEEETCDEETFCTNGGTCLSVKDVHRDEHSHYVCKCPPDRTGTRCEYTLHHPFGDSCTLTCLNNGSCTKGFKSFTHLLAGGPFPPELGFDVAAMSRSAPKDEEHCMCPDGFTGLTCEIAIERCSATKYCYHGSKCSYDEEGTAACDCGAAHREGKSYAGLNCEQVGTSFCKPGQEQDEKHAFCANNGVCIEDEERRHEGCVCPAGWTGDLCDVQQEVDTETTSLALEAVCDLDCSNDGSCRFGAKGYKDSHAELELPFEQGPKHERGMHCACKDGFAGLKCEVDVNQCRDPGDGSGGHFCLHGKPCVEAESANSAGKGTRAGIISSRGSHSNSNSNGEGYDLGLVKEYGCDCDARDGDVIGQMAAGRFCEFAATEYCSSSHSRHSKSFCTNGGKCKGQVHHDDNAHHGCCCPEGFEGDHCQLPVRKNDPNPLTKTWSTIQECADEYAASVAAAEAASAEAAAAASAKEEEILKSAPSPNIIGTIDIPRTVGASATAEEAAEEEADVGASTRIQVAFLITGLVASVAMITVGGYRHLSRRNVGLVYGNGMGIGSDDHSYDPNAVWPPPQESAAAVGYGDGNGDGNVVDDYSFSRTWDYSQGQGDRASWEYSNQHGPLDNVDII